MRSLPGLTLCALMLCGCSRELRDREPARPRHAADAPAVTAPPPVWLEHRKLWTLVHDWGRLHGERSPPGALGALYAPGFRGLDVRPGGFRGTFDLARWGQTFFGEGDSLWVSSIDVETWLDPGSTLDRDRARVKVLAGIDSDGWEESRSEGVHRLTLARQAGAWRIISDQVETPSFNPVRQPPLSGDIAVGLQRGPDDDGLVQLTLGTTAGTHVLDLEMYLGRCTPETTQAAGELIVLRCGDAPLDRVWVRGEPGRLLVERGDVWCVKCQVRDDLWHKRVMLNLPLAADARLHLQ